ncbi:YiiD C-terminal domain-containing protein [Peredibacter starrii]|uniref:YiiD C-terminal domain-containing protein n=1 Tax=Peredibacter starrii TaxID=28202 RepID=A0AAX4HV70_9BACT|nr:YiiD C-terminal domain-containing protein [Peredibacter starrii]WPU67103.1 YiiD C-terminal domain-containing protein [Peredibacter starrii]
MRLRQLFLEKIINFYGPFVGAGVRLQKMTKDYRHARVSMKLTFYNKNYMGTQFGGSLYAMVDPWYMLMLIKNLGRDYIVWDKAATINFRKPGRGTVYADFNLTDAHLEEIQATLATQNKMDYIFKVEIKDKDGKLIADVDKVLYIRRKST